MTKLFPIIAAILLVGNVIASDFDVDTDDSDVNDDDSEY